MLGLLGDLFGGQARSYGEQGIAQQRHNAMAHLLYQAGDGHMVLAVEWKDRNGWPREIMKVFPTNASNEEIEAWKKGQGWPGHPGGWWNYFVDDVHRLLTSPRKSER